MGRAGGRGGQRTHDVARVRHCAAAKRRGIHAPDDGTGQKRPRRTTQTPKSEGQVMPGSTLTPDDFRTLRTAWSIARVRRDVDSVRKTPSSKMVPIAALVREQWERARTSPRGQSSSIVATDPSHQFRQTVLAVTEGHRIAEHHEFQMTTVHVLVGQVRVASGTTVSTATCGDLLVMPRTPHSLTAVRDSVVLLTSIGVALEPPRR